MLAFVSRVDFVSKMDKNCVMYNTAFVHIHLWMDTTEAIHFLERIEEKGEARIVYDDPSYWIVLKNNSLNQKPKTLGGRRIRLDIVGDDSEMVYPIAPALIENLYPIAPALPNSFINAFNDEDISSVITEEGAYDDCSVTNTEPDFYELDEPLYEGNYDFVDSSYANQLEKIIEDLRAKENAEYLQDVYSSRRQYGDEIYIVDDIVDEEYLSTAMSVDC